MKSNPYKLRSKKTDIYKQISKSIKSRRQKFGHDNIYKNKILDADPSKKFYSVRSLYMKNKITNMKREHKEFALRIHDPKKKNFLLKLFIVALILLPIVSTISKRSKENRIRQNKPPEIIKIYLIINKFHDRKYLSELILKNKYFKITNDKSQAHIIIDANNLLKPCSLGNFVKITSKLNNKTSTWKIFDQKYPCDKHFISKRIFNLIKK